VEKACGETRSQERFEMQLKTFLLPIKNLTAPEGEMNAFLRSHRVLAVKKEI
jgi:hypothetical protein